MTKETIKKCDCCGNEAWEYCFTDKKIRLGRCPNCGLYYVKPMPTENQRYSEITERTFATEQKITSADTHVKSEQKRASQFEERVDFILKHAPAGRWLDIGCGTGVFMKIAQQKGIEVEGIELTPDRLAIAREMTGAPIYDKPVEKLGLEEKSYAVVTLNNVFSHLLSPKKTFREINKILCEGGLLFIRTSEIGAGVRKFHSLRWDLGDHLYFLGDSTIEYYAKETSYEVVDRKSQWAPDILFRRSTFATPGRSAMRNLVKLTIAYTPGLVELLRLYMLHFKHRNNPHYLSQIILKKRK